MEGVLVLRSVVCVVIDGVADAVSVVGDALVVGMEIVEARVGEADVALGEAPVPNGTFARY